MFDEVEDPRLHGFVVWGPMLGDEERADAVDATRFLDDARTTHFWTDRHRVAEGFSRAAGLPEEEPGWDIYLLYGAGAEWDGERPPEPDLLMHVGHPLPDDQRLHGPTLRRHVHSMLDGADGADGETSDGDGAPEETAAGDRG